MPAWLTYARSAQMARGGAALMASLSTTNLLTPKKLIACIAV